MHADERISHAELLERVERVAHGLAARGIGPGDAVAVILPNGPAFVTAFLAITGLGAIVVPLNPAFKADERDFCLRACDVRELIADEQTVERLVEGSAGGRLAPRAPEETFVYQFSSGSTGRPKRLARTHAQLWAEAESYRYVGPDDRDFCVIPLFHTDGMGCCLVTAVCCGATLVFLDEPAPVRDAAAAGGRAARGRARDRVPGRAVQLPPSGRRPQVPRRVVAAPVLLRRQCGSRTARSRCRARP